VEACSPSAKKEGRKERKVRSSRHHHVKLKCSNIERQEHTVPFEKEATGSKEKGQSSKNAQS